MTELDFQIYRLNVDQALIWGRLKLKEGPGLFGTRAFAELRERKFWESAEVYLKGEARHEIE